MTVHQTLGMILENKGVQNLKLENLSPKLIFLNGKKSLKKIH
jgi:hypothetical protein